MASVASQLGSLVNFEFVAQQSDHHEFTKETKTRIRRQAMKAVGEARRQSGLYGKNNLLQRPPDLSGTDEQSGRIDEQNTRQQYAAGRRGRWRIKQTDKPDETSKLPPLTPPMPISGLEVVMRDHGIDLGDLSALTAIHIGPVASKVFATQPHHLPLLMSRPRSSYLDFARARFGHYKCLDDAMVCLAKKAQYFLTDASRRTSSALVLSSYSRALMSLKSALSNPEHWLDPEVLCATKMLGLVELLESDNPGNWSPHILGASKLLRARGPENCTSEFEQSLVMALVGPLVCEAFIHNEVCFLEEANWQATIQSLVKIDDVFSDFCPVGVEVALILVGMPGMAKRVTDVVHSDDPVADSYLDELIKELRGARQRLLVWRNRFDMAMIKHPTPLNDAGMTPDKRLEHLGTFFVTLAVFGRMLQAIMPSQRELLEDEVLAVASEIELLEMQASSSTNHAASFYMLQKGLVSDATVGTTQAWRGATYKGRIIDRKVFDQWCHAMPRKTT